VLVAGRRTLDRKHLDHPRAWNTTVKSCLYGSGGTSGYKRISDTASRIQPAT